MLICSALSYSFKKVFFVFAVTRSFNCSLNTTLITKMQLCLTFKNVSEVNISFFFRKLSCFIFSSVATVVTAMRIIYLISAVIVSMMSDSSSSKKCNWSLYALYYELVL